MSAAIHQNLRRVLLAGEPVTYEQLASAAGCTVRSVRNYLARAEEIFGFSIDKTRDAKNRTLVRIKHGSRPGAALDLPADPFARALVAELFDRETRQGATPHVIVSLRGLPSYGPSLEAVARQFEKACGEPPCTVVLKLAPPGESVAMRPVAVVVHNIFGVLLVGYGVDAQAAPGPVVVPLERVQADPGGLEIVSPSAAQNAPGPPEAAFDASRVRELLGLPFGGWQTAAGEPMTKVHVRFHPAVARHVAARRWHHEQRMQWCEDGSLEVRFGPVALSSAVSWVASFGKCARVRGSKKLKKAVKSRAFMLPSACV